MNHRYSKFARFLNRLLYIGSAAMMMAGLVLSVTPGAAAAVANPGAIWTTDGDCGISSQDVNHFSVGDQVYINFSNFTPGTYNWQIQQVSGNPKPIVASGSVVIGASGAGCFNAHTVQPSEGGHEYTVDLGTKNDNYQVNSYTAPTATSSAVPTATNTAVPTATNTAVPTATNTAVPTATNTAAPTATNTAVPTATNTAVPTATGTLEPTATGTLEPTATSSAVPTATATDTTEPTVTNTPVPTATEVDNNEPTPTDTPEGEPTSTPGTPKVSLKPLALAIDPFCTIDNRMQWTVENPNDKSVTMYSFVVDGGAPHAGFPVAPGEVNLTTTALGTHTVTISYGEAQSATLTYTIDVCPLQIPVTGGDMLIPVTGANLNGNLGNGLMMGSLSLAGLGLVFSSLRKIFHL